MLINYVNKCSFKSIFSIRQKFNCFKGFLKKVNYDFLKFLSICHKLVFLKQSIDN